METKEPKSVSTEILGESGEIKKLFRTYVSTWTNIKAVVEDYYHGGSSYTRPFKYALSIIAPYVLVLNIIDFDFARIAIENFQQPTNELPAKMAALVNRYNEVYSAWSRVVFLEFLPLFYAAIFAPLMAFLLSKFFKSEGFRFSYYYAITLYTLMSICTVTFFMMFAGYASGADIKLLTVIGAIFTIAVFTYATNKIFRQGILISAVKIVLIFVISQLIFVIPMSIATGVIAYFTL